MSLLRSQIRYINKKVPCYKLLQKLGYDVNNEQSKSLFCPFHNDKHHKSARFYVNDNLLMCFANNIAWTSYRILTKHLNLSDADLLQKIPELNDLSKVGSFEGQQLSKQSRKQSKLLSQQLSSPQQNKLLRLKNEYKNGKIDFYKYFRAMQQVLDNI